MSWGILSAGILGKILLLARILFFAMTSIYLMLVVFGKYVCGSCEAIDDLDKGDECKTEEDTTAEEVVDECKSPVVHDDTCSLELVTGLESGPSTDSQGCYGEADWQGCVHDAVINEQHCPSSPEDSEDNETEDDEDLEKLQLAVKDLYDELKGQVERSNSRSFSSSFPTPRKSSEKRAR
jgi:hypothetical protein